MGWKIRSLGKTPHPPDPSPWKPTDGAALDWNFLPLGAGKKLFGVCRGRAAPIPSLWDHWDDGFAFPRILPHSPLLDGVSLGFFLLFSPFLQAQPARAGFSMWDLPPEGVWGIRE